MEVDFVEWMDGNTHFSLCIDFDTLEEIMNKGSLEDGHEDILMQALRTAWAKRF